MFSRQQMTRGPMPEKMGISARVWATPRIPGLAKPTEKPDWRPQ